MKSKKILFLLFLFAFVLLFASCDTIDGMTAQTDILLEETTVSEETKDAETAIVDEPDEPVTPDEPEEPDEPVIPDEPEEPDEPVTPDEPEEPEEPDEPVTPDEPEEPEEPDEPTTPDEPEVEPEETARKIVVLGDSIAAGYGLPQDDLVSWRYGDILAGINGWTCTNYARDGYKTSDVYKQLQRANAQMLDNIAEADIIIISAVGNDYFQCDIEAAVTQYLSGSYAEVDKVAENAVKNLNLILDFLRERNAEGLFIVQTLYNPLWGDNYYINFYTELFLEQYGVDFKPIQEFVAGAEKYNIDILHSAFEKALIRVNFRIKNMEKTRTDNFAVADVYGVFCRGTIEDSHEYFSDGIHPSEQGHAMIAALYQSIFKERRLVLWTKPIDAYRTFRTEQAVALYPNVEEEEIRARFAEAADMETINRIFFGLSDGK